MSTTTTTTPAKTKSNTWTQSIWAGEVLLDLNLAGKIPASAISATNIQNIERWMTAEEPPNNWFHNNNPLNVNAGGSGSDSFPDLGTSAAATAQVLQQSNMAGILAAISGNASPEAFSAAVVASPWAASHYGGSSDAISSIAVPAQVSHVGAPPTGAEEGQQGNSFATTTGAGLQSALGIPGLGSLITDLLDLNWWKRVGIFVLGAILSLTGIYILTKDELPSSLPIPVPV